MTRPEIRALAGPPASADGETETYPRDSGRLVLRYAADRLVSAILQAGGEAGASTVFYSTSGSWPRKGPDLKPRREYLEKAQFAVLPRWAGPRVWTHKYRGTCYEVDGRFVVVEPILDLLGARGYFEDKAARVLLVKADGSEELLYRAADQWGRLRPPGLSFEEVRRRRTRLREVGEGLVGRPVGELLGPGDSQMGSGVSYQVYYLEDALMVVQCTEPRDRVRAVRLVLPGLTNLTYPQWLAPRPGAE
ncbi:MAG: hypothetical protein ACKOET_20435 [Verrucomicrobiota bacterium]